MMVKKVLAWWLVLWLLSLAHPSLNPLQSGNLLEGGLKWIIFCREKLLESLILSNIELAKRGSFPPLANIFGMSSKRSYIMLLYSRP
jgi:hypothetical protein